MVLIRPRHKKMASPFRSTDNEEPSSAQRQAQIRARQENRRRAVLYNLSSPSGRRMPSVSLQPADARMRRDLLRLAQQHDRKMESEKQSAYEDEQNDCKHREHLCYRPPMDNIQKLRDLHTTVAKDCRGHVKHAAEDREYAWLRKKVYSEPGETQDGVKAEWRLGYSNSVDTGSRAGVACMFEPRDGTRERILDCRSAPALLPSSVAVAYPVKKAHVEIDQVWREPDEHKLQFLVDTAGDNQVDGVKDERNYVSRVSPRRVTKKKPWCPASNAAMAKSPSASSPRLSYRAERFISQGTQDTVDSPTERAYVSAESYEHDGLQRFPIRSVESFDPIDEAKEGFVIDARCAQRQHTLLTKVADTYARVRARMDRMKDPHLRYELPIEDAEQHPRAYRLGLDAVPSTQPKRSKQLKFRPKSAGMAIGFQPGSQGPKEDNLLTPDQTGSRVAGAKRRPHSASITYFKHSTVYCMGPPTPSKSNCVSAATDFRSVVTIECQKRKRERESVLKKLATRGLLHTIPLAQVFARLRREALHNVDRRMQHSIFERMTVEEYMSACGCIHRSESPPTLLTTTDRKQHPDTPGSSPVKDTRRFSINSTSNGAIYSSPSVDVSPSLLATRGALVVSRQQFHLALEAFNLSSLDVNLLFSALDVTISDRVQIWDAMCAVEVLQHEHTALRRARVQQLQAPSKDLDFFRRLST